jgi:hypothetical protein
VKEGGHGRPPFPPFEGAKEWSPLDRYRVWHPFDHVSARYVRTVRRTGSEMALCEVLARDPRYAIDVVSTIEKLDEQGFTHKVVVRGFELETDERIFAPKGVRPLRPEQDFRPFCRDLSLQGGAR